MNRKSPNRLILAVLSLAILFTPLSGVVAQKKVSKPAAQQTAASPLDTLFDLGSSLVNSATNIVSADPYSQFRDTRYSNRGLISEADEIKLGNQINTEVSKKYKFTSEGQARVNRVGQRVARSGRRPNLNYQFHVIKGKEINAFAAPGGHIYVTTALINLASDQELASVLAHEVGHVVARHSLKSLEQANLLSGIADLIGSVTGVAGETAGQLGSIATQIVGGGLLSVHTREEEREADFLGVHTMVRAGYDPEGMITMFQKIQRVGDSNSDLLGAIFADHPDVSERIENTRYEIEIMRRSTGRS